jgi:hypothetical protein
LVDVYISEGLALVVSVSIDLVLLGLVQKDD